MHSGIGSVVELVTKVGPANRMFSTLTRKEVKAVLLGGYSHAKLEKVIRHFPAESRGVVPAGLPYSAWQILEHMRVVQQSMLSYALQYLANSTDSAQSDFRLSRSFWAKLASPPDDASWEESVHTLLADRARFVALIDDATDDSLTAPSGPRNRKTILRLALQMADHNAYHAGQLVILRRLLGCWKR